MSQENVGKQLVVDGGILTPGDFAPVTTVSTRLVQIREYGLSTTSFTSAGSPVGTTYNDEDGTLELINYWAYDIVANIIVSIGIFSNVLNLIVLTRPKLKGVMYLYLLGLAVSNLFVLITAIPALKFAGGDNSSRSYAEAFFMAHFEIPLLNSFMAASVYIILCMTVNRYISIYHPTHFQRIHTFKNAYIAIAASFAGGFLLHIPLMFYQKVEECLPHKNCFYEAKPNRVVTRHQLYGLYTFISEALLRFAPIITLTILNVLIIVRYNRIARKREVLKGNADARRRSSENNRTAVVADSPPAPAVPQPPSKRKTIGDGGTRKKQPNAPQFLSPNYYNGTIAGGDSGIVVSEDRGSNSFVDPDNGIAAAEGPAKSELLAAAVAAADKPKVKITGPPATLAATTRPANRCQSTKRRGLNSPEERMLVVVLIAIVVLFIVCTTPAAFLSIFYEDEKTQTVSFSAFRAVANNLELLGFALNFFVYCLCSADIRQAFVDVVFENRVVTFLKVRIFASKQLNQSEDAAAAAAAASPGVRIAVNRNGRGGGETNDIEMTNISRMPRAGKPSATFELPALNVDFITTTERLTGANKGVPEPV